MESFDIVIAGAGIAGASLAHALAGRRRVLLLEREPQPGYHATGRSAAMFMESYGPPQVRALTRASRAFYTQPPEGFAPVPLMHPRGVLYVAQPGQEDLLAATWRSLQDSGQGVQRIDAHEARARVPVLRPDRLLGALAEPGAQDIDVNALHQGFLRGLRAAGGTLRCGAGVVAGRHDGRRWTLQLDDGDALQADVLVDAAGAWADVLAQACGVRPLGLQPCRRSAFTFDGPAGTEVSAWPTVVGIAEDWYFKPDAGRLLGSPANADPVPPQDVQPEALDIATAIHRIAEATTLEIRRPASTWAGLRTFAPDGEIVIGFDGAVPGFFWLAGQGGYGIQSAAGCAALAAALLCGEPPDAALRDQGVDARAVSPARFQGGGA
ncbi:MULTISPECIES: FAD-dependent oxidoreductase [Ramlibacter]|uniref:FAD-binding oxidoreductase n=1 Tax=Ramlibacter aquaticus TaxID=2780094 RepID=A0ABR9SE70_9BURK|nr:MULTISPECIES: FAD-dependent oxidoreductase [Ramlibacter]MBE7940648.1 FAD-binding oxidoreductase [Ramlibacter aquaticus]